MAQQNESTFREYRYNAGRLQGKRVRDVSNADLLWALVWNERYMDELNNPQGKVRYQGRRTTVGTISPDEVARLYSLALAARNASLNEALVRYRFANNTTAPNRKTLEEFLSGVHSEWKGGNPSELFSNDASGTMPRSMEADDVDALADMHRDASLAATLENMALRLSMEAERLDNLAKQLRKANRERSF